MMAVGLAQQSRDGGPPASLFLADGGRVELMDGVIGAVVQEARLIIVEVMAKVRTHDDQRLGASPKLFQGVGDLFDAGGADDDGDQAELFENRLEERQMHLQAVFLGMSRVEGRDGGQGEKSGDGAAIDGNPAQRRFKGLGRRYGQTGKGDTVRRAEQDDAGNIARPGPQARIDAGGDRTE